MQADEFVNKGCIVMPGRAHDPAGGRTIIVSGLGRSGTTMTGAVLRAGGLHLGTHLEQFSGEDLELWGILRTGDRAMLDRAIGERNARHRDWGFKLPTIQAYLQPSDLERFRNPHLVIVFRDPIAIAVRGAISEYFDQFNGLADTVVAINALVEFIRRADCPSLLHSYEKALIFPAHFVDVLASFCGLDLDEATRQRMVDLVQPNEDTYVRGARRNFVGAIDLLEDGFLHGWCCQTGDLGPVPLDLFLNGRVVASFPAACFRADLVAAGYGSGNHGFRVDLAPFLATPDAELRVRVSGRTYELANGGRPLRDYAPGGEAFAAPVALHEAAQA